MMSTQPTNLRDNDHARRSGKTASLEGYAPEMALRLPHRIAHFLDWLARTQAGKLASYAMVVRAIMGFAHTPSMKGKEVRGARDQMTRVREILADKYQRGLVVEPGFGVRATVGADDVTEHVLAKNARRLVTARNSVEKTMQIIDPSKIESDRLRKFHREAVATIKQLDEGRIARLLPPAAAPVKK
jgi:hypothetical protein